MDLDAIASRSGLPLRILVTRLRYLGDVVLTTPVIEALRECLPDASIWYMSEKPYSSILRGHPALEGIIETGRGISATLSAIRSVRKLNFTAAIDLFYNPRSANILKMAGIPVRIGGARKWRRRLYTHIFEPYPWGGSAIEHHLAAIGMLGCPTYERRPRVFIEKKELEFGKVSIRDLFGSSMPERLIAIHPGGTWPAKRWSVDSFAALSRAAASHFGAGIILITGPGEEAISEYVASKSEGAAIVMPGGSIRQVAAVIATCGAVVANDGGVMHVSVALGVPTVGIFGPTEKNVWFPYEGMGPFKVITRDENCAPCHLHECCDMKCLDKISVEEAVKALAIVTGW